MDSSYLLLVDLSDVLVNSNTFSTWKFVSEFVVSRTISNRHCSLPYLRHMR